MSPHDEDINGRHKCLVSIVLAVVYVASSREPVDVTVGSGDKAVKTGGNVHRGLHNLLAVLLDAQTLALSRCRQHQQRRCGRWRQSALGPRYTTPDASEDALDTST